MKYKRLTLTEKDEHMIDCLNCPKYETECEPKDCIDIAINRLSELEDKIEDGTLVELPCRIGTKIYIVGESDFCIPKYQMWEDEFCLEDIERFGDTVFLTKADAERQLKKLRGENKER